MSETKPLIRVRGLSKHFTASRGWFGKNATLKAVDNVSLDILPGETYGLVGESGCGKSTLGRSILRLFDITSGDIEFAGQNIAELSERQLKPLRRRMQSIFQDPWSSLNPGMTVAQLIAEPMRIHGYSARLRASRTLELLKRVGLNEEHLDRFPHEFSGGQRQRISIARALSVNPEFVLCDEPLSALDVSVQAQVVNLLQDLQQAFGLTYLFIAHDLSMVRHISDRIGVMYLGSLVEEAPAERLYHQPAHPYTRALLASIPVADPHVQMLEQGSLKGENAGEFASQSGCKFAERCPRAMEQCREQAPQMKEIAPGHRVACWQFEK
ncbi:ABC transporter ATP-binding protein [Cedecea davisae]|uniref:ABC transporter ATP-binding protein n=1 Tax=Cedecea davisae TaxID=158484 RepID=A0ABS6DCH1_9ENTR|nr:ABC transporter ATP-binding protein [Cedecea davisae]MBU4680904.1 ABC transporter ATP-binding protein [Cedecea davisae]MBU4687373.1 ABC transporter ATP-binding protein [Cedecea davisae]